MKHKRFQDEEALVKEGVAVLMKKLGPVETNRFLSHNLSGRAESVKRHREWQKSLSKDSFFDETIGK